MKKRILSLFLAFSMLLTCFVITDVVAAGASYADDDTAAAAGYVCRIGAEGTGTYYQTLPEAVAVGGNITLIANVTLTSTVSTFGGAVTIDGQNLYGISAPNTVYHVFNGMTANLVLKNMTVSGAFTGALMQSAGTNTTLELNNVTATPTGNVTWALVTNGSTTGVINIIDSTITMTHANASGSAGTNAAAIRLGNDGAGRNVTVNITNSTVDVTNCLNRNAVLVPGAQMTSTINVTNSTLRAGNGYAIVSQANTTTAITSPYTITSTQYGNDENAVSNKTNLTIDGKDPSTAAYASDAAAVAAGMVCRIGAEKFGDYYSDFATAVGKGGTVTLIANVTLTASITSFTKATVIDGQNMYSITANGMSHVFNGVAVDFTLKNLTFGGTFSACIIQTVENTTSTITVELNNVTVSETGNTAYCLVNQRCNGTVNVINSNISQTLASAGSGGATCAVVRTGNNGGRTVEINITGSTIDVSNALNRTVVYVSTSGVATTINVSNSTLKAGSNYVLLTQANTTTNITSPWNFTSTTYGSGADTIKDITGLKIDGEAVLSYANDAAAVADGKYFRIGAEGIGTYFATLAEAVTVVKDGETIEMIADFTITSDIIMSPAAGKIAYTVDGNGHTISGSVRLFRIAGGVHATFVDITLEEKGTAGAFQIQSGGNSVTLGNGVTVQYNGNAGTSAGAIIVQNGATLYLEEGASVDASYNGTNGKTAILLNETGAKLVVNGGTLANGTGTLVHVNQAQVVSIELNKEGVLTKAPTGNTGYFKVTVNYTPSLGTVADVLSALGCKLAVEGTANVGYGGLEAVAGNILPGSTILVTGEVSVATGITLSTAGTYTFEGVGAGAKLAGASGKIPFTVATGVTLVVENLEISSANATCTIALTGGTVILNDGATVSATGTTRDNSHGVCVRCREGAGSTLIVNEGATLRSYSTLMDFEGIENATVTINGGTFETEWKFFVTNNVNTMTVTINGGIFTQTELDSGNPAPFALYSSVGTFTVSGVAFNYAAPYLFFRNSGANGMILDITDTTVNGNALDLNTDVSIEIEDPTLRLPGNATVENSGISFISSLDIVKLAQAIADGTVTVEYGTLVRVKSAENDEIAFTEAAMTAAGASYLKVDNSETALSASGKMISSLVNGGEKFNATELEAVGYLIITVNGLFTNKDGVTTDADEGCNTYVYYTETVTASVQALAEAYDYESASAAQKTVLDFFVLAVTE